MPAYYGPSPISLEVTARTWLMRRRTVRAEAALLLSQAADPVGSDGDAPVLPDDGESKDAGPVLTRRGEGGMRIPIGGGGGGGVAGGGGPRPLVAHTAVGDFHVVLRFADLRGLGASRRTPLHAAALDANATLVRELLRAMGGHWAFVRAADGTDMTPLDAAAAAGSVECVRLLLDAGGCPSSRVAAPSGRSVLHFAVAGHAGDAPPPAGEPTSRAVILALLLSACARALRAWVEGGAQYEAIVDARDAAGDTAVALACARGEPAAVQALLRAGADLGITNLEGDTPLMRAIRGGHAGLAEALLKHVVKGALSGSQRPCRPRARNKHGVTALMLAAECGDARLVRALIDSGVRRGLSNVAGDTVRVPGGLVCVPTRSYIFIYIYIYIYIYMCVFVFIFICARIPVRRAELRLRAEPGRAARDGAGTEQNHERRAARGHVARLVHAVRRTGRAGANWGMHLSYGARWGMHLSYGARIWECMDCRTARELGSAFVVA